MRKRMGCTSMVRLFNHCNCRRVIHAERYDGGMTNLALDMRTVPIDSLKPHPRNVRQGNVGAIMESVKSHGLYRPIVVQLSTSYILAGNHTWQACRKLKLAAITAVFIDVDDNEALRIMLVDNKTSDEAVNDEAALTELLKVLEKTDTGLLGTGYDLDDLDDLIHLLSEDNRERERERETTTPRSITCPEC